jgi:autotransporter-associated beta strand protein
MTESGGVRSLTVLGPGAGSPSSTLTLGATNNYSGGINVQGNAILAIQTISNIGQASPIGVDSVNGGLDLGTSNSRGTLLLTGTNATYSTNHTVFPAGIYPNGGAIGVQNAGTTLTWNGQIYNGTGALIKTGLGTLALTNTANSYTGGTYVEAGTLYIVGVGAAIPANTDVTVMSGATMLNNGDNNGSPLHTVTLIGGTLHCLNGAYTNLYLNRLVTDTAGGTVVFDVNAAAGHLYFTGTGAGATINGNTSWNGAINALIVNASAALADITIAPAATLACNVPLSGAFRILGGGALYLTTSANISPAKLTVTQGRLRVDDLSVTNGGSVLGLAQPGLLTLDGGTQQYTGSNASSPMPITLSPVGGAVEVSNASTTLTLAGTIGPAAGSAAGPLVKTGPGVLMLNNLANTYVGGITVSGGRLDVGDDAQLGGAAVTVNPAGTLRYTADATTARTFNLTGGSLEAPSGVTLILNAAAVNGGFLRGTGTFAVNGGTVLSGVTTASSTQVNLTARGSFVNFTNGGRMNITPPPAVPATFDLFTNQGSGAITIGQDSQVSVSDFQSYGTLTLNPGSFNGSTGNVTQLTNTGGSPLYFNGGSRTFISSVAQAANGNAGFDLHGNDAIVAGGLFVNNGFVYDSVAPGNHRIVADFGAVVKGAGFYQPLPRTINGGTFVTGNSPGRATTGAIVLGGPNDPNGGLSDYTWQINDAGPSSSFPSATGISGPTANAAKQVSGWGTLLAVAGTTPVVTSGDFRWDATPVDKLTIHLRTLIAPDDANGNPSATGGYGAVGDMTPGLMSNFDPTGSYSWRLFAYAGSYTGPTDTATLDASVILDTADFLNPHRGRFDLVLNRSAQEMDLVVTPTAVPEPGTLALVGLAGVAWVGYWRRRWLSNCPPRTPSAWPAADFRLDIVPR